MISGPGAPGLAHWSLALLHAPCMGDWGVGGKVAEPSVGSPGPFLTGPSYFSAQT